MKLTLQVPSALLVFLFTFQTLAATFPSSIREIRSTEDAEAVVKELKDSYGHIKVYKERGSKSEAFSLADMGKILPVDKGATNFYVVSEPVEGLKGDSIGLWVQSQVTPQTFSLTLGAYLDQTQELLATRELSLDVSKTQDKESLTQKKTQLAQALRLFALEVESEVSSILIARSSNAPKALGAQLLSLLIPSSQAADIVHVRDVVASAILGAVFGMVMGIALWTLATVKPKLGPKLLLCSAIVGALISTATYLLPSKRVKEEDPDGAEMKIYKNGRYD